MSSSALQNASESIVSISIASTSVYNAMAFLKIIDIRSSFRKSSAYQGEGCVPWFVGFCGRRTPLLKRWR